MGAYDRLNGGSGNDIIEGGADADTVSGGSGNDWLYGDDSYYGGSDDYVVGGSGNDYLYGGGGDDELIGGNDNDTIEGGVGNDELVGGAGAGEFRFEVLNETTTTALVGYDRDKITDFEDGVDTIKLLGVTDVDVTIDPIASGGTLVTVSGTDGDLLIELVGVDSTLINEFDDFVYI